MINYVSKSFRKKLSEFSLRSFFLLHTTLNSAESVPLSGEGFFRTLNSVSYCKRRILKVKNNIRCFFLNVQSFLRPVCFEKKIGSVSLKRQLKRREEIWITKRTLWCYFQVYLSQKKRKGAEQRQYFKATHFIKRPSFQGQGVDLDTNIEGRIQENVRIVFTSKNNEMWLNIFFFFFFLHCSFTDI